MNRIAVAILAGGLVLAQALLAPAQPTTRVSDAEMQGIFDQVRTPYKFGVVIPRDPKMSVDCPTVFSKGGSWYMSYIQMDEKGYSTLLAQSPDLLHWKTLGTILKPGPEDAWDAKQAAGSVALIDHRWGGSYEPETVEGKYWMTYIGGAKEGYETPPLSIGAAYTADPTKVEPWTHLPAAIFTKDDAEARDFEKFTLYRCTVIHDPDKTVGHPYVAYYNAKDNARGSERIGMAVSDDMIHWQRFGREPVIDTRRGPSSGGINGDPQIVRIGDLWVMFYFGAFYQPGAFDTFACSRDLVHWTVWEGEHLIAASEPWDKTFAHKPWMIFREGIVYHFYCAVGAEGRIIALATSQDLSSRK